MDAYLIASRIRSSKNSALINAIPSSSLTTIILSPDLRLNLSLACFGITIWPLSLTVTVPQIFFPLGAGGIYPA